MEDAIKKFIYTSVGMIAQTSTKLQEMVNELIRDRKISEEEGKRIVEDFTSKTKAQTQEIEDQARSFSSKFKSSGLSPEQEIEQLRAKIRMLESQLSQAENHSTPANEIESPGDIQEPSMERDPLQEKKELFLHKLEEQADETEPDTAKESDSVTKVVNNERVSLGGDILTPEKKIEAEQKRMHQQADRPTADRREQDTQKANLSGPVLTPGKKAENDKREE